MGSVPKKVQKRSSNAAPKSPLRRAGAWCKSWWRRGRGNKVLIILAAFLMLSITCMYSIAQWYYIKHRATPMQFGATFIPDYAASLGLEPEQTLDAMTNDLGIRRFRFVSYWENGEKIPGTYDFAFLDWQMNKAQAVGAKVSLAIGLRQPRWPECHMPKWAAERPMSDWEPQLLNYITAVVERYRNHPALESYQLENEFFLKAFGDCPDHSRDRLVREFHLVKSLDSNHPLIVSMSNNAIGTPIGEPTPDEWAISVYKRVWDQTITKRYFEYPLPAWYYAFRAGFTEITRGHDSFIHELQAEAWLPPQYNMLTAPNEEFYKSMNPERLHDRFQYGKATGMKKVDLWGVEWWYYMKERRGEPGLWEAAKQEYQKANQHQ